MQSTAPGSDALSPCRCKLEEQDGALTERLERLHERRRELQNELDRIMGEILSAEQQQTEVAREREQLGRMVTHKAKSLEEAMQVRVPLPAPGFAACAATGVPADGVVLLGSCGCRS